MFVWLFYNVGLFSTEDVVQEDAATTHCNSLSSSMNKKQTACYTTGNFIIFKTFVLIHTFQ